MDFNSLQHLGKFISDHHLKSKDAIVLFDAAITLYRKGNPYTFISEIQIITLPKEMVLYVLEFIKDIRHESEVYSTSSCLFIYTGANTLEVRDRQYQDLLLFSLKALNKSEVPVNNDRN